MSILSEAEINQWILPNLEKVKIYEIFPVEICLVILSDRNDVFIAQSRTSFENGHRV